MKSWQKPTKTVKKTLLLSKDVLKDSVEGCETEKTVFMASVM